MSETATTDTRTAIDTSTLKWASGFVSLVGLWIAVSPLFYGSTVAAFWNNVIIGGAIFLLAGFNYYRMTKGLLASVGVASLVALLGVWSIIVLFVFAMGTAALAWSTLISGIIIAAISGYNAYANRKASTGATGAQA